jgi:hypothetical protein
MVCSIVRVRQAVEAGGPAAGGAAGGCAAGRGAAGVGAAGLLRGGRNRGGPAQRAQRVGQRPRRAQGARGSQGKVRPPFYPPGGLLRCWINFLPQNTILIGLGESMEITCSDGSCAHACVLRWQICKGRSMKRCALVSCLAVNHPTIKRMLSF